MMNCGGPAEIAASTTYEPFIDDGPPVNPAIVIVLPPAKAGIPQLRALVTATVLLMHICLPVASIKPVPFEAKVMVEGVVVSLTVLLPSSWMTIVPAVVEEISNLCQFESGAGPATVVPWTLWRTGPPETLAKVMFWTASNVMTVSFIFPPVMNSAWVSATPEALFSVIVVVVLATQVKVPLLAPPDATPPVTTKEIP